MRVLRSELAASCFVVQIDDLLNGVANVVVVHWLVVDDHVALLELHRLCWSSFRRRLALTCNRSGVCCSAQDRFDVWFVLRDKCGRPLTLVVQVVDELEEVEVAA